MKITKILSVLIILVALVGCSSDDDSVEINPNDDLLGTWVVTGIQASSIGFITQAGGVTVAVSSEAMGYDINLTWTFEENPNELTSNGSFSFETETNAGGQISTSNIEGITSNFVTDWVRNNGVITITNEEGEAVPITIVNLSSNALQLTYEQVSDYTVSGLPAQTTTQTIYFFTR